MMKKDNEIEKILLNVGEVQKYLGIGETMARRLLRNPKSGFAIRIGNRLYANKRKLDKWLDSQCDK